MPAEDAVVNAGHSVASGEGAGLHPAQLSSSWQRVWRVLGANGLGQVMSIGTQLVALPLFLHFWSLEQYGIWLLISAAPAYFSLADVGVATVAMNRMSMLAAENRHGEAARIFGVALGMTLVSTLALLGLAAAVIWSLDLGPVRDTATRMTLSLLILATLAGTFTPLLDGSFRASGRAATGTLVLHLLRLVEWLGGVAGLMLSGSMVAVAAGALAGRLSAIAMAMLWTARKFPTYRWWPSAPHGKELREMLPQAMAFLSLPVGNALILQGVSIVVGSSFGPAALAVFSSFRTLSRIPVQMLTMFSRSLWPEFSRSYGARDYATLARLYHRASRVSLMVCGVVCVAVFFAGPLILDLWTHGKIHMNGVLLALFLATALAGCAWQIEQVLLSATNAHVHLSLWYFLAALAVVLLAALLPASLGMEAKVLALFVFEIAMLVVSRHFVNIPLQGGA
jgi:O-antigen/teichoic acid export membrane protein